MASDRPLLAAQVRFLRRLRDDGNPTLSDGETRLALTFPDGSEHAFRTIDHFLERRLLIQRYQDGDVQKMRLTAAGLAIAEAP